VEKDIFAPQKVINKLQEEKVDLMQQVAAFQDEKSATKVFPLTT
jgi:hypothetical protein